MFESQPTIGNQNPWSTGMSSTGAGPVGGGAGSPGPIGALQQDGLADPPAPGSGSPNDAMSELFSHYGDAASSGSLRADDTAVHAPGLSHGTRPQTSLPPSLDPSTKGRFSPGRQDRGNEARSVQRLHGPEDRTTQDASRALGTPCDQLTWRGIGNLRGNPPVRSEDPPNMAVVEDQATYERVRRAASAGLAVQQSRAEKMKSAGEVLDNRYWFAKVYSYVTKHELEYAESKQFYYPTYVMYSVRYFEKIYADNLAAAQRGDHPESHWAKAFITAAATKSASDTTGGLRNLLLLASTAFPGLAPAALGATAGQEVNKLLAATMSLVASMKAHIRFDLPRAEVWVFNSHYKHMTARPEWRDCGIQDTQLADFQTDFGAMFGVFERATEDMNKEIAEYASILAKLIPGSMQDWAMSNVFDADMKVERVDTWARALELQKQNPSAGPYKDDGSKLIGDVTAADNMSPLLSLAGPLRPSMESSAEAMDDDDVRGEVQRRGVAGLVTEPVTRRLRMIQGLLQGSTGDDDEAAILTLLQASSSANDLLIVVDSLSAHKLASAIDGDEYDTLRELLKRNYYPFTNGQTAFSLMVRCMDGETAEWEEEMIADILTSRSGVDGRALIEQIGEHYENRRDFNAGLNKIEWQLDGNEQEQVAAIYGKSH